MKKLAVIRLFWTRSPSPDVASQRAEITIDGVSQTAVEFDREVEEMQIEVKASSAVSFRVVTIDTEGMTSSSVDYTFQLGDLESPLPATNLGHEIVIVRDADPVPPVEPPAE